MNKEGTVKESSNPGLYGISQSWAREREKIYKLEVTVKF